jgi:hypothetical protein
VPTLDKCVLHWHVALRHFGRVSGHEVWNSFVAFILTVIVVAGCRHIRSSLANVKRLQGPAVGGTVAAPIGTDHRGNFAQVLAIEFLHRQVEINGRGSTVTEVQDRAVA